MSETVDSSSLDYILGEIERLDRIPLGTVFSELRSESFHAELPSSSVTLHGKAFLPAASTAFKAGSHDAAVGVSPETTTMTSVWSYEVTNR
jgi:hypothetical protein